MNNIKLSYTFHTTEKIIIDYCQSLLQDTHLSPSTRYAESRKAIRLLSRVLFDIDIALVDRYLLGQLLVERSKDMNKSTQSLLYKHARQFLFYLINCNFYSDQRFDYLTSYSEYLNSHTDNAVIVKLLCEPEIYRYKIVKIYEQNYLVYLGSASEQICSILSVVISQHSRNEESIKHFYTNFDPSCSPYIISSALQFTFKTFLSQVLFLRAAKADLHAYSFLVALYNYVAQRYNPQIFSDANIDARILLRQNMARLLYDDYKIVAYNPLAPIPEDDKLLLFVSGTRESVSSQYSTLSKAIDFSSISCPAHKQLLKDYLWHSSPAFASKIGICVSAMRFFAYLHQLNAGQAFSIYHTNRSLSEAVLPGDCMAYVHHVAQQHSNSETIYRIIKRAKYVLDYGFEQGYAWIDQHSSYYLTSFTGFENTACPINDDDLRKLCSTMSFKSKDNTLNYVLSGIVYLMITTSLRLSEILSLSCDCIHPTMKEREHVLRIQRKTSNGKHIDVPISSYTKDHLTSIIQKTQTWRDDCLTSLCNNLFLKPAHRKQSYVQISTDDVRNFLTACCEEAGIPRYLPSNLRDTQITKAQEYRMRHDLSEMQQTIISGHTSINTDARHYVKLSLTDMLEATYGIIVGKVPVAGSVVDMYDSDNSQNVANQCGFCGTDSCESYSYLSCLMCSHFIATQSNIPFFEAEIARIDAKLKTETIPHTIEDLQNIKRLLIAYTAKLLELHEEVVV